MDLIAVCTVSGSVWVARWYNALEKIWTLTPSLDDKGKVETLAWRPDGKVIAIGYSNGIIRLYNVDKLEMIHELIQKPIESNNSLHLICAGINCLHWVHETCANSDHMIFGQQEANNFLSAHPIQKYLPRLNTLARVQPISKLLRNISETDGDEMDDETTNSIDLLLAGDAHGNLHL
ncbi:16062_t:CDS:2, partial [Acaulospora morrowiae]